MPFSYAQGDIFSVSMTVGDPCKVFLQDTGNLRLQVKGSILFAADGTPWAQTVDTGIVGAAFGVFVEAMPITKAWQIENNIKAAMNGNTTGAINLQDDFINLGAECIWDFASAPAGPTFPQQFSHGGYINNYTLRFLVVSGTATAT